MEIRGLTDAQVQESKAKHGDNRLTEIESEGFWAKLLGNFGDPMIKILCAALLINVVIYILGATGVLKDVDVEWYEPLGIALAVLIATFVSTFSEYKNENAFQKLQAEASLIKCKLYRNGQIVEIPIDDIVTGDCVLLQSGDKIPADGKIIDGTIKVDQSVLNGESKEATKVVMPEDYSDEGEAMDFLNKYKVFRGAVVCSGNAVFEVTTVGDKSVYGQIAKELQQGDDRESPLKVKLGKLADGISKFGYIGGCAIAVAFMIQRIMNAGGFDAYFDFGFAHILGDFLNAIILAVIIIVMAVPEGLPLMIALVSAMNMGKMLKDNVLVRKINGIETAGSLNILFSDKTGTITKGKLEVVTFIDGAKNESNKASEVGGKLGTLMSAAIQNNTSSLVSREGNEIKIVGGNATEKAVLGFAVGVDADLKLEKVTDIPFNSTNKYSATQVKGDLNCCLVKGAPEKILRLCSTYYDANGEKQPFDNESLTPTIDALANRAIRVLAIATCDGVITDDSLPEGNWTLIGILGIRDEVRPESITAIAETQKAGVQVVMITGDRKETAVAIAKEAGLLKSESELVYTSDELAEMSDDDVKAKLKDIRVIARALPSDKSRLVRIAQELNLVVGMTGDGVNDSPALKKADVGFAMGGGTEVAKEASEIVILDDNFNSIGKAILYGRTIYNSIRKFIIFQLTINVAAVLISFICPLLGMDNPLTITQILWVNLVMDTLAALAFGGEPALKRFMEEKPKRRDEAIVSKSMWSSIITGSLWTFGLSLTFLLTGLKKVAEGAEHHYVHNEDGLIGQFFRGGDETKYLMTGYFALFIFISVFNAFNARTDRMNLFENINGNKGFLKIIGLIAVVQIIMTYLGGAILNCYGLNVTEWAVILVMAVTIIPVDLIRKAIVGKK